jgi:hypothetical protein
LRWLRSLFSRAVRRSALVQSESGDGPEPAAMRLTPEEVREILSLEATWCCLAPRRIPGFIETTMHRYGIARADMEFFLRKRFFNRADVWRLQVLKRKAQGDAQAVEILGRLHRVEVRRGEGVLQAWLQIRQAREHN